MNSTQQQQQKQQQHQLHPTPAASVTTDIEKKLQRHSSERRWKQPRTYTYILSTLDIYYIEEAKKDKCELNHPP